MKKSNFGVEQIKLLIATAAIAATMALWSVLANRDRLASLQISPAANPVAVQELSLNLEPLPTLVPFAINGAAPAAAPTAGAASAQSLRSVSAPPPTTNTNRPVVVRGNRSNSGPVTNGRTS